VVEPVHELVIGLEVEFGCDGVKELLEVDQGVPRERKLLGDISGGLGEPHRAQSGGEDLAEALALLRRIGSPLGR
jgi:hypothetical protein